MELIRALLDSRRLNFIGYSYGTWLGGWYADTYPGRVGRFVLDSNMDFTRTQWQNVNFDPFSFQRRRDTQLFPWIARNADLIDGLGNRPARVLARYESIRAGLVSLVRSGESTQRAEDLDGNVASAIYSNVRFVRATLDILVHDEFVRDPSDDGDVDAAPRRPGVGADQTRSCRRSTPWPRSGRGTTSPSASAPVDAVTAPRRRGLAEARRRGRGRAAGRGDQPRRDRHHRALQRHEVAPGGAATTCEQADRNDRRYPFFGYLNGVPMCAYWPYAAAGPRRRPAGQSAAADGPVRARPGDGLGGCAAGRTARCPASPGW